MAATATTTTATVVTEQPSTVTQRLHAKRVTSVPRHLTIGDIASEIPRRRDAYGLFESDRERWNRVAKMSDNELKVILICIVGYAKESATVLVNRRRKMLWQPPAKSKPGL